LIRTYLDSGVLISASRCLDIRSLRAISVLDDPNRVFVASEYLKMELIPKATFHKSMAEFDVYMAYFESATSLVNFDSKHYEQALALACKYGLAAFDSLHLNAALISSCDEFITTERPTSPLFRVPGIRILTLSPPLTR